MEKQLSDIKQLRALVSSADSRKDLSLVRLYINDTKMLSREYVNFYPLNMIYELEEYRKDITTAYWYPAHSIDTLGYAGSVISYCQPIRGKYYDSIGAFLVFDIDTDQFLNAVNALELPGDPYKCGAFLIDSDGKLVNSSWSSFASTEIVEAVSSSSQNIGFFLSSVGEYAYIQTSLSCGGWKLALVLPRRGLLSFSRVFPIALTLILIAMLCFKPM